MSQSRTQIELNAEIAQWVQDKVASGDQWTKEDCAYAQKYMGDGGAVNQGVDTRGTLYEYYTPDEVCSRMMALAYKHGFVGGTVLEPSVGVGRFLHYLDPSTCTVDAYEWSGDNNVSYHICRNTYPFARVFNAMFESHFYSNEKRVERSAEYDLVIGNPPYNKFKGYYSGPSRESRKVKQKRMFSGKTYDQYFLWAGIKLLKPGGILVMIVPSTFMQNASQYTQIKSDLFEMADLVDAYRMFGGLFSYTGVNTDILVFKKR